MRIHGNLDLSLIDGSTPYGGSDGAGSFKGDEMARERISLRKILSDYPGTIRLEKPSIPRGVRVPAKRKNFDPERLYRIIAILPGEPSASIIVRNDIGEHVSLKESEVLFQDS
jgi:hypothetical protein